MISENKIQFQRINGQNPRGKYLEILVDGNPRETIFIQLSLRKSLKHVRIIGSRLFDEKIAYPIKDLENYTDIIEKIEKRAKNYYGSNRIRRFFSNNSEVKVEVQKSYSLT